MRLSLYLYTLIRPIQLKTILFQATNTRRSASSHQYPNGCVDRHRRGVRLNNGTRECPWLRNHISKTVRWTVYTLTLINTSTLKFASIFGSVAHITLLKIFVSRWRSGSFKVFFFPVGSAFGDLKIYWISDYYRTLVKWSCTKSTFKVTEVVKTCYCSSMNRSKSFPRHWCSYIGSAGRIALLWLNAYLYYLHTHACASFSSSSLYISQAYFRFVCENKL